MTNPVFGFINTIGLFLSGRIAFDKDVIGKSIYYKDKEFKIFRRVKIKIEKIRKHTSLFDSNLKT